MCIVMILFGCGQNDYKGDGKLETGFIFYPKFRVTFPKIPLNESIKRTFTFKNTPNYEFILRFGILRNDNEYEIDNEKFKLLWEALNKAQIEIEVNLTNSSLTLKSVGPVSLTKNWVLAAFGKEYYFWHKELNKLRLKSSDEYKLEINVHVKEKSMQKVFLVPILEGGGFGKGDIYKS